LEVELYLTLLGGLFLDIELYLRGLMTTLANWFKRGFLRVLGYANWLKYFLSLIETMLLSLEPVVFNLLSLVLDSDLCCECTNYCRDCSSLDTLVAS
jgi:hypothetical protein